MSTTVVNILKVSLHPKTKAVLNDLSFNATKLWNTANYQRREIWKETGEIPNYEEQYHLMKDNKWYRSLQTQSAQTVLKKLDASYKAWYKLRKKDPTHRPPGFKPSGFKILDNNTIRLSVLKDIKQKHGLKGFVYLKYKELLVVPKDKDWYIHIVTSDATLPEIEVVNRKDGQVASIDLGVKHHAVMTLESGESYIFKGGLYNSIKRYWDKETSKLKSLVNTAGHKTSNRLKHRWKRRKHQINDIEHKLTRTVVDICDKSNVSKIVIGDLTDIRIKANYSKRINQKFR